MRVTLLLEKLQAYFAANDYASPVINLLQPADPFLDTAGEDLRRRMFMTIGSNGESLCLRPEFTIPVGLAHLNTGASEGSYAYGGSVFRQNQSGPAEFLQAGVEIIGGIQNAKRDVQTIAMALGALRHCQLDQMQLIFGDQALFESLLLALDLPDAWRARIGRAFGDNEKLERDLSLIANGDKSDITEPFGMDDALRNALASNEKAAVIDWVSVKMSEASLPVTGGRTATHIAERMMTKAQLMATQLTGRQRNILNAFLQLEVPVQNAVDELRRFAKASDINIDDAIELFADRAKLMTPEACGPASIIWRASFGRRLDYYTGIAFEIYKNGMSKPVCGGGRYDQLMNMLGASKPIAAIGFSIWIDRLSGEVQ